MLMLLTRHLHQSHRESSPGSFDECRQTDRAPTLRPSQPTWALSHGRLDSRVTMVVSESADIKAAAIHSAPSPFVITQPVS